MNIRHKLKKAIISDKIYFNKNDIVDVTLQELKYTLFSYNLGEEIYSTLNYDENTNMCSVPSGAWSKLDIEDLEDCRHTGEVLDITCNIVLKEKQKLIVDKILQGSKLYSGLIQAPCGFGKSYVGAYIIGNYKKPTLIVCHTKLLANQWLDVLKQTISNSEIGFIGDGKESIKPITVGIYKSLLTRLDKLQDKFEVIIVDEGHLCMAETFSRVVNGINSKVKITLTATPVRKDGLHVAFADYFGPNRLIAVDEDKIIPEVQIIDVPYHFNVRNPKRDWTTQLTKLTQSEGYLDLIVEIANSKLVQDRCILILSERVSMLEELHKKLPKSALLVGKTKNEERDDILSSAGIKYNVILSTKIFDEGISCHRLDTLFLTCPGNNPSKLEQRIGRIQREHPEKQHPLLVDFWLKGMVVGRQQKNRLQWYVRQQFKIKD